MKKNILTILAFSSICLFSQAQQLENGNFESWEGVGTPQVEPTDWSSIKTADALAGTAPQVLTQDIGNGGNGYCMKLEVKTILGIAANGIATSGRVHADIIPANGYVYTDASDPKWNTAFTARPDSLVGWYKYAPQNNDKGKVQVLLHTGAGQLPGLNQANLIGNAKFEATTATATWTRFSVPFVYASSNAPEFLLSVVTAGDSTQSKNGSTIWVDDIELIYNSSSASVSENQLENMQTYFSNNVLKIKNIPAGKGSLSIFNLEGKEVYSGELKPETVFESESGVYFVHIQMDNVFLKRKVFK